MDTKCIFPVAYNGANIQTILEESEVVIPDLIDNGAENVEVLFAGTDYKYVDDGLVGQPKGRAIIDVLKDLAITEPTAVIVCDGSNKIPYGYIADVFKNLVSGNSTCVMANRVANKAISPERELIERFEVYTLKKYHDYGGSIPDGQCGLWGYVLGLNPEKEIYLTAQDYGIENDLLDQALGKKHGISFVDVELPEVSGVRTNFTYQNNINKLHFILRKHRDLYQKMPIYMDEFEETDEFRSLANNPNYIQSWNNYKKDVNGVLRDYFDVHYPLSLFKADSSVSGSRCPSADIFTHY